MCCLRNCLEASEQSTPLHFPVILRAFRCALINLFVLALFAHDFLLFLFLLVGASLGLLTGVLSVMASAAFSASDFGAFELFFL